MRSIGWVVSYYSLSGRRREETKGAKEDVCIFQNSVDEGVSILFGGDCASNRLFRAYVSPQGLDIGPSILSFSQAEGEGFALRNELDQCLRRKEGSSLQMERCEASQGWSASPLGASTGR